MDLHTIPILVVDDSRVMRRIITKQLHTMGFVSIFEAGGVKEACRVLDKRRIGLILSDLAMPGLTGLDLLIRVRADARTSHLPFLLLTAEAQVRTLVKAYRCGASQYVTKPFTAPYFKYIINKVLRETYGTKE